MIKSFRSSETQRLFADQPSKRFRAIQQQARRKLEMIHAAEKLDDLRNPPGNRLERLKGDRAGQFSIRINDQFRICFRWVQNAAEEVEIVDYH
jgi:Plasmid maintenance system killer protein